MRISPRELLTYASEHKRVIIWPTVIFTLLAMAYAVLRPTRWEATQALFVRDESIGSPARGGRFDSTDAMQTAQETILEIALHPLVLEGALRDVGPRKKTRREWPTNRHLDDFRECVRVKAPNGAQFGRTEMIYLSVEARDRQRAVQLTDAVSRNLIRRMMDLRLERYDSIVTETEKAVSVARGELDDATRRLETMEKEIGMDLAELRVLMDQGQGEGNVRRALNEIEGELRKAQAVWTTKKNQQAQLVALSDDPRRLITMPSSVLDRQPTLKKLKEGLVDAQLKTSQLRGVKNLRHPDVQAAMKAEQRIRSQLHRELQTAVKHLQNEVKTAHQRVVTLSRQKEIVSGRMGGLAAVRTRYSNLATEVRQRAEFLELAESNLAVARSNRLSAESVSLIQRIEEPIPGTHPLGLSRKVIVLGGFVCGLLTGCGVLFLMLPAEDPHSLRRTRLEGEGQRTSDRILEGSVAATGRRAIDRFWPLLGRRRSDQPPAIGYWDRRQTTGQPPAPDTARRASDSPTDSDPAEPQAAPPDPATTGESDDPSAAFPTPPRQAETAPGSVFPTLDISPSGHSNAETS